jgi:hypothetical protein
VVQNPKEGQPVTAAVRPPKVIMALEFIKDPLDGAAGQLLNRMNSIPTWTKERRTLLKELVAELNRRRYITFTGNYHDYSLTLVGQSWLCTVPPNRNGHLMPFRGHTIHLVCVGTGKRNKRIIMAGVDKRAALPERSSFRLG